MENSGGGNPFTTRSHGANLRKNIGDGRISVARSKKALIDEWSGVKSTDDVRKFYNHNFPCFGKELTEALVEVMEKKLGQANDRNVTPEELKELLYPDSAEGKWNPIAEISKLQREAKHPTSPVKKEEDKLSQLKNN